MLGNDASERMLGLERYGWDCGLKNYLSCSIIDLIGCNQKNRHRGCGSLWKVLIGTHIIVQWLALDSSYLASGSRGGHGCEGFNGPKECKARVNWNSVMHICVGPTTTCAWYSGDR
jgi:hypothetical protein